MTNAEPTIVTASMSGTEDQVIPSRLPTCHRYALFRVSASVVTMTYVIMELKKYDMAVPRRISVAGVMRTLSEMNIISIAGINAPMNALVTIPISPVTLENDTPTTMAATAPKHAPEDIPVEYGSARGFPMRDCMSAPQTASDAPAIIATRACGIAVFQMYLSAHQNNDLFSYSLPQIWSQMI